MGGPRDRPTRQQTLHNTIAWSYALLGESEQALFRGLGVFVGGCTLEAAESVLRTENRVLNDQASASVLGSQSSVLGKMASLIDKSLLRQEEATDGSLRFMMLETVREYALERLEESGEANIFHLRQAQYFLTQLELVETQPLGAGQPTRLHWWKAEQDNLRAALSWSLHVPAHEELNLRLAIAVVPFVTHTFDYAESNRWLEQALENTQYLDASLEPLRLKAMSALGITLATLQQDYTHAIHLLEESLSIYRRIGDHVGMADVLIWLGRMARDQGNYQQA